MWYRCTGILQLSVCKRKLQSKEAALKILKTEVDYEREQKEHFKHVISAMVTVALYFIITGLSCDRLGVRRVNPFKWSSYH